MKYDSTFHNKYKVRVAGAKLPVKSVSCSLQFDSLVCKHLKYLKYLSIIVTCWTMRWTRCRLTMNFVTCIYLPFSTTCEKNKYEVLIAGAEVHFKKFCCSFCMFFSFCVFAFFLSFCIFCSFCVLIASA